jgi:hypothetical protein
MMIATTYPARMAEFKKSMMQHKTDTGYTTTTTRTTIKPLSITRSEAAATDDKKKEEPSKQWRA